MNTLSWQNRLYTALLAKSKQGSLPRHGAYLAAGWLSFFLIRPTLGARPPASFSAIAGGGILLVSLLLLAGPILSFIQPGLALLGRAPAGFWPAAAILTVLLWRYVVGRRLLTEFAATLETA